jgi:ketosteroid isomerase-like protein
MRGGGAVSLAAFNFEDLEQFTRVFEELFDAGDPEGMTSYYTGDARLMAEGMEPVHGHAAIGQFWRVAIDRAAAARAQRTIQLHESSSSGDLGYALCTVQVEIPAGNAVSVWDATIWRRDPSGAWRISVDISTPLPPR